MFSSPGDQLPEAKERLTAVQGTAVVGDPRSCDAIYS